MFLIVFMQALFAATFPIGKLALAYASPFFLVGARFVLAGVLLLSYYYWRYPNDRKFIARSDWSLIAFSSVFYVCLSYIPEFWAMDYLSSLKTNILWSLAPFVSAVLSYFLVGERLSRVQIAGIVVGTLGMIPIFLTNDQAPQILGELAHVSLPEIMMIVAVVFSFVRLVLIKRIMDKGYPLVLINGVTMGLGGLLSMTFAPCMLRVDQPLYTEFWPALGYSLLLLLLANIIGYGIYGILLQRYSLTFLSFSGFLCPIFGALFGYLMGEALYIEYLVAGAFIFSGLCLFNMRGD